MASAVFWALVGAYLLHGAVVEADYVWALLYAVGGWMAMRRAYEALKEARGQHDE